MIFDAQYQNSPSVSVYTMFAICEYLVVLTNIFYHGTAYWDFKDYVFIAQSSQGHRRRVEEDD